MAAQRQGAPVIRRPAIRATLLLIALLAMPGAYAASLNAATTTAQIKDGYIEVPILYQAEPGEKVSGLQFEIVFNAGELAWDGLKPGSSSEAAAKMVSFNAVEAARYRVIIAGFNQNAFANGPVAIARFQMKGSTAALRIENAVMSDPMGRAVEAEAQGGSVGATAAPTANTPRPACGCGGETSPPSLTGDRMFGVVLIFVLALTARRQAR